jgi:hypothetical protein
VLAKRLVERYETKPEEFDYVNRYDGFYMNKTVLTSKEYDAGVWLFIGGNCELGSKEGYRFTLGCGEFSYEPKEYFVDKLKTVDASVGEVIKKISTLSYKQKLKKHLMKFCFTLSFDEVTKYISPLL